MQLLMIDQRMPKGEPTTAPQRPEEVVRQLVALQQYVAALHELAQTLLQEVQAIKAAQTQQAELLEQMKTELSRGRWWRRLTLFFRLLVIGALVGTVLYFLADWQAFWQFFV